MKILTETKKITMATVKSFIKHNKGDLFVSFRASFDGMTDCVEQLKGVPYKAEDTTEHLEHSLGIKGAWFVGSSRDYFRLYEDEMFKGIDVSNCCGHFILAVIK